jgi:NADH-quinone oxidoreductase subunit J
MATAVRALIVVVFATFVVGVAARVALAQPGGAPAGAGGRPVVITPRDAAAAKDVKDTSRLAPHGDIYEAKPSGKQPGMALLFWAFAAAVIGGALFVITRRNLIAAVMGMVGCFLGISAVYMMLYAHFLSVVQMLVYAGAIMVLFVFVIMILNRPEDEPVAPTGRIGQAIAGGAILYLTGRLIFMLINVRAPTPAAANAPAPVELPKIGEAPPELVDWGSVKAVGKNLFTDGLFPFEAISILLLVAVVGAIAIARPIGKPGDADSESEAA